MGEPNQSQKKQKPNDLNVRRSTRNLGRTKVKYDDQTMYGDVDGLYDSDQNERENKKKTYNAVHKKRKRGGIKKLKQKSKSKSSSKSPKIKITHKASPWNKKTKNKKDDESEDETPDNKPLYTYSMWLDDVVSDTQCQYKMRSRLVPAKINSVQYLFEIQTALGAETFIAGEDKIKGMDVTKMDVDENEDDDIQKNEREWFEIAKVGDSVLCFEEEKNEWIEHEITFKNRRFDVQYFIRKSLNTEIFYEYDQNDKYPNDELRNKVRPTIEIAETPEPNESVSITPSKKKKKRFDDSDESEEDNDESSEEYEEEPSPSRSISISPIDDLPTKIEQILFRLRLPKNTKCRRDTFNHLSDEHQTVHSKQEMDIDEGKEDKENIDVNNKQQMDDESMMIASDDEEVGPKLVTK